MSNLKNYYFSPQLLECGIDEAGCGTLFGRVYTAAVIWNPEIPPHKWLNDSKKVTEPRRNFLYDYIKENAIDYSVTYATETDIDKYGIYKAKLKAMHLALENLNVDPDKILVDGDYFVKYWSNKCDQKVIPHTCIPQGDSKYTSISAASILAKVSRDNYIQDLCDKNTYLDKWYLRNHKGYCTAKHVDAIKKNGITKFHRKTFGPCKYY